MVSKPASRRGDVDLSRWSAIAGTDDSSVQVREYARLSPATFPGSTQVAAMRPTSIGHATNEDRRQGVKTSLPDSFVYATVPHTEFDPDWPIKPDWPYIVRGLRRALEASQVAFADLCSVSRPTVERWEAGSKVPHRGDALQLLKSVKRHLRTPIQAGQALNLAAAVVLPRLTRPTARYTGRQLVGMLKNQTGDHTDLGRSLLTALLSANILLAIDPSGDDLEDTFVLLAGQASVEVDQPPWLAELAQILRNASDSDRQLVLAIARRTRT
jgi:DNA-binding XRE family transcriptional regulator